MSIVLFAKRPITAPRHDTGDCVHCICTGDGFLVVLDGASPLHLHHTPLDAAVVDVTKVLGVPLHALGHGVRDGRGEAAFVLLKVLVVSHLEGMGHNHSLYMQGRTVKRIFHPGHSKGRLQL